MAEANYGEVKWTASHSVAVTEDMDVPLQQSRPTAGVGHALAAAYQQMGKTEEARAAMQRGMELRPGSTYHNVPTPTKNSSPVYIEAAERIMQSMVAAGLPAS